VPTTPLLFPIWQTAIVAVLISISGADKPSVKNDLVFLTRDGCVNTEVMKNNLDNALRAMKLMLDYQVVDIGTLPKNEPRAGYPAPTVLWKGKDIFGMPVPIPPFREPS
jgi:hypothetical protein